MLTSRQGAGGRDVSGEAIPLGHDEDYYFIPTYVGILPTGLKMLTCVSMTAEGFSSLSDMTNKTATSS